MKETFATIRWGRRSRLAVLLAVCTCADSQKEGGAKVSPDQTLSDAALAVQQPDPLPVFMVKDGEKGCCELALLAETEEGRRKIEGASCLRGDRRDKMWDLVRGAALCCRRSLCR